MNAISFKRLWKVLPSVIVLTLSLSFTEARADSPENYGHQFGLFVDERNHDLAVPKFKGMQILESYFSGSPLKPSYGEKKTFMSQREFLLWFEKLTLKTEGKVSSLSDDLLYPMTWVEARRNNWLPETTLTYGSMREFFYRYSVSKKHDDIPYHEGLVLSSEEINADHFSSFDKVEKAQKNLGEDILRVAGMSEPNTVLIKTLQSYQGALTKVQEVLRERELPINKIHNLPQDIREKIIANNLNQVLASISYDYSRNTSNRIHNMITGAMQISGTVYPPGQIINFTDELGKNGWDIYQYGWVILGGKEAWEFGGGLCGSATLTFTPSWKSGIEILTRYPHSVYYKNLYPEESFGLDATIYRGGKNLIMRNNTSSPILYYLENDKEHKKATMYLIGNSPYKNVTVEGPITVGKNNFKWVRRMEQFDGTVAEDEIFTKYNMIK